MGVGTELIWQWLVNLEGIFERCNEFSGSIECREFQEVFTTS